MAQGTGDRRTIEAAAARWVARLAEPGCSDADRAGFAAWRAERPEHLLAYERMAAAWDRFDRARALRPAAVRPDADALAPPGTGRPAPARRTPPLVAASLLVACAAAAVVLKVLATPAYATSVGERRAVVLADGSRLELNTDSKVVVHRRPGPRTFDLVRGEAIFRVAPGVQPARIRAGGARLLTAGGELRVRLHAGEAVVEVLHGQAEAVAAAAPGPALHLAPGLEGVVRRDGAAVRPVSSAELGRTLAWRQGAISLDGTPLGQAVAEFNRYNRRQVVIADPAVASLPTSGYFDADDVEGFVGAVERIFPVRATSRADGRIYLTSRASRSPGSTVNIQDVN